jgi:hypothetical protein
MRQLVIVLLLSLLNFSTWALVEIAGQYGFDRQVYGATNQNKITTETKGGSIALYLFDYTAIEVNFHESETITRQNSTIAIDSTYDVTGQKNTVLASNYGLGIRQAFAPRKARFRPSLSIGYARQFIRDTTEISFLNKSTSQPFSLSEPVSKRRIDSVFGTFSLQILLTQRFSLKASAHTIFPAFEFNRAQYNMKYLVGFSWYL